MRYSGITLMSFLIIAFLFSIGCNPKETPQMTPKQEVPAVQAPVKAAWEEEWEKIIMSAKKEGRVVVYGSVSGTARQIIWGAFTEKYNIPIESVSGRSPEIIRKVLSERNAGLYLVDVLLMGPTEIITILKPLNVMESLEKVLLLPEVRDPELWLNSQLPFIDPEKTIFIIDARASGHIGINTNLVKPGEIKSARDLLNPKWKGKIILNDFTSGTGSTWMSVVGAHGPGWDYLRELAKQEPVIVQNDRLMVEWLAHGRYAILVPPKTEPFNDVKAAGGPVALVDLQDVGYTTGGGGSIVLMKNSPHPYAAKLFINWLSSREGQIVWQKAFGTHSARIDIPTDYVDPLSVRNTREKYFNTDTLEFRLKKPEYIAMALEIFKDAVRK